MESQAHLGIRTSHRAAHAMNVQEIERVLMACREDMERVAPHWWELTLPVLHLIRADKYNPEVSTPCSARVCMRCLLCTLLGFENILCTLQAKQPFHKRIWYSEMHAYALGAAKEGVHHVGSNSTIFHMDFYHPHGVHLPPTQYVMGHMLQPYLCPAQKSAR